MKKTLLCSAVRGIRGSIGRFLAILAIIALGVGFYAGLSSCESAMLETAQRYIDEYDLFDYRIVAPELPALPGQSCGLTDEDIVALLGQENVAAAEGSFTLDAPVQAEDGGTYNVRFHSIPTEVNRPKLLAGRLPTAPDECAGDSRYYTEADLGKTITVTDPTGLSRDTFTLTALVCTPYYLNFERGSTKIGNGTLACFIYLPGEAFSSSVYSEIFVRLGGDNLPIYSDAYAERVDAAKAPLASLVTERLRARLTAATGVIAPEGYVAYFLGRDTNVGYACFESDATIVRGIARVFPIFFFMVAALICMTTMTRMIEEQRTRIGTLKALGYGRAAILGQYALYAGGAALLGCLGGFFLGTFIMPRVIWLGYNIMYGFTDSVVYVFKPLLFVISLAASLLCSVGTTLLCCADALRAVPAALMRPHTPKSGRRILLERIAPLWNHLSFLRKVSLRNIFRYKKRMVMMIVGIGGCTALMITGLGIGDSIKGLMHYQYDEIMLYDGSVSFSSSMDDSAQAAFAADTAGILQRVCFLSETAAQAERDGARKQVKLIAADRAELGDFIDFHSGKAALDYPGAGEALISRSLSDALGLFEGDALPLRVGDTQTVSLRICGVFDNYVYNYAFVQPDTLHAAGIDTPIRGAYFTVVDRITPYEAAAQLSGYSGVAGVSLNEEIRTRVDSMMRSLDYIVAMVILCAAALAFIVLFNLTNINITERVREIATVKVLGFTRAETAAYVFRENIVLTAAGALVGLPFGRLLHRFVMSQIKIDMIYFASRVQVSSYLLALGLTFLFAVIVDLCMRPRLNRINMAESLKSIE